MNTTLRFFHTTWKRNLTEALDTAGNEMDEMLQELDALSVHSTSVVSSSDPEGYCVVVCYEVKA